MRKRARVRKKSKEKKAKGGQAGDTLGGRVSGKQRMPNVYTRKRMLRCYAVALERERAGGGEGGRERGGRRLRVYTCRRMLKRYIFFSPGREGGREGENEGGRKQEGRKQGGRERGREGGREREKEKRRERERVVCVCVCIGIETGNEMQERYPLFLLHLVNQLPKPLDHLCFKRHPHPHPHTDDIYTCRYR
jgi:hypothetical protein